RLFGQLPCRSRRHQGISGAKIRARGLRGNRRQSECARTAYSRLHMPRSQVRLARTALAATEEVVVAAPVLSCIALSNQHSAFSQYKTMPCDRVEDAGLHSIDSD